MKTNLTIPQHEHARKVARRLGAAIVEKRRMRRLTQTQLAAQIGIHRRVLSRFERGDHFANLALGNAVRILGHFNLTIDVVQRPAETLSFVTRVHTGVAP